MRNLLALFGLLVIGFAGAGWYMGWYKLSVSRSTEGTLEIKTDVNTKKVSADTSTIFNNAAAAVSNQADKAAQDTNTSPPVGAPGGTPGPVTPSQGSSFNPLTPAPANTPPGPFAPQPGPFAPQPGPIQLLPPK